MVLSISVPFAAGATADGQAVSPGDVDVSEDQPTQHGITSSTQQGITSPTEQWTTPPGQFGQVGAGEEVDEEKRNAAEAGVDEAVALLQRQGVSVNQSQRAAAVNASVDAVAQYQEASVEQVQNATLGAVSGTFLQSQNVSIEQVQNATFGGASGALSQHQNASAYQLQHAAFGATHGAVAQSQNATVEQVQIVAQGAAAGAAHEAGKHDGDDADDADDDSETVHPGAIREAAQGAAFGALTQEQNVTVEQRQYAATGAAEGALNQTQSVTVEQTQTAAVAQNGTASVKQIQVAAMGAARGALTVTQEQEVTVEQIQSAARGACKGALTEVTQIQQVSITQIQEAAFGAAKGAISQSQQASVTQIQAAATGGAHGVLVQKQTVSITQIQYAASGAAKGAANSAAQNQVVNVEQIQAAAAGAGQGSVIQIQQINIVMIQVISESAAGGALSQHQEANVVQIQSAARGASEGSLSLTQRQEVSIEQTQIVTQNAAADTAATAAELNIDVDVTIYNYARGTAEDPDDEDDELRSLFVDARDDTVFLANPNGEPVTVTITSDDGDVETVTLAAGESTDVELDRGTYTLTAETADGEDVELAGRIEITLSVGDELQSLTAEVEDQRLAVENPNDERVTVSVEGDVETSFDVPGDWDVTQRLGPGTYTATAETQDGEPVPINDDDEFEFSIESEDPEPPEPPEAIDLSASVEGQELTVENPSETDVAATVTPEDDGGENGEPETFDVPAGEDATQSFDPGNYTLTADAEGEQEVQIDSEPSFEFAIESDEPPEPINVTVSADDGNVTFDNPSDANVTVTASDDGDEETFEVPGDETITETLAPGNYTLTGESDDEREVLLNNETEFEIQIEEPPVEPDSLNVTVEGQNVTLDNPNDMNVTVTANVTDPENATDAEDLTVEVPAESTITEEFEPGNYTLTAATDDGTVVPLNGEEEYDLEVAGEPPAPGPNGTLTVEDQAGNGTTVVVANASATVPYVLEVDYDAGTASTEPFDANDTLENATFSLDPPIEDDGNVTVTLRASETDEVLANETITYDVRPFATVTVEDQTMNATSIVVQFANLTEGGFLVAHANSTNGTDDVLGTSEYLPPGEHENVTVTRDIPVVSPDVLPAPSGETTVNVTAHEDTNDNQTFDFVNTTGEVDGPYVNETGYPVSDDATLTFGAGPEPGVEYVNCTTAQVTGTYDRLGVTLNYYAEDGNTTSTHVRTAADVPGDLPVDGETLVTVGETNETTVTDDGVLVVQIADTGAFGDADPDTVDELERSFVLNVNTSASPTGQEDLSTAQPTAAECRENVRPESPTLAVESVEAVDNETALVNLSYENPNDAPLDPAESLFTDGEVVDDPPQTLEPGQQFALVEWTPASPDEAVTWTVNLSNFDLANESVTGPTAADVTGLLEPPAGPTTPEETPEETPEATPEETPTPTPEPSPEGTTPTTTPDGTPTPGDAPTPGDETA